MQPLADRIRPKNLNEYIGQKHIIGKDSALLNAIKQNLLPSLILWGPPGVGKTSLAFIIATELKRPFYMISAINSGVKDIGFYNYGHIRSQSLKWIGKALAMVTKK